jgi:hypothetical protein
MQLESRDIEQFVDVWGEEFGETLTFDQARYHASQLLGLYELLADAEDRTGKTSSSS